MPTVTDPIRRTKLLKLARLANFLDDLPHNRFHMPDWVSENCTATSCGTAGCACGWAATVYAKEGWTIKGEKGCWWPSFQGNGSPWNSFSCFFGLDRDQGDAITQHLDSKWKQAGFASYCYEYDLADADDITPRHAADRIRKVLNGIDPSIVVEAENATPPSLPPPPAPVGQVQCPVSWDSEPERFHEQAKGPAHADRVGS